MSGASGLEKLLGATPRLRAIAGVLARHGFLHVAHGDHRWPPPPEVRLALEELGVVFLKLGQVLALRRDLLPDAYVEELERLHDRLPAAGFDHVRATVERELGAPLAELFASFDEKPLAAATIAQVHAATLTGGRSVVVKVRRQGLEEAITEDIAALSFLAAAAENLMPSLRAVDAGGLVRQLAESLRRETDFRIEARTIQRFRSTLAAAPEAWIPDVVAERSTAAVLTMEHSPGARLDAYLAEHPESGPLLARRLGTLMLRQVFVTGSFHADPHPGNLFVLPEARLCFHDFGMVGELDEQRRDSLTRILEGIVATDARAVTEAYLEIVPLHRDFERARLEADLGALLRDVRERAERQASIGDTFQSLLRIGSKHGLRTPDAFLLLARALLVTEGVMRRLDPRVDLLIIAREELPSILASRYSPGRLAAEGGRLLRELERLVREAPGEARRGLRRLADGDLGRVNAPGLEAVAQRLSRDVQRLTGALAAAALVVGGSMLASLPGWHRWLGDAMMAIGIVGTALVALGALLKRADRRD